MSFGVALAKVMERRGLSELDLRVRLVKKRRPKSAGTVESWLRGYRTPDFETLRVLADVLECSVDELMGRAG